MIRSAASTNTLCGLPISQGAGLYKRTRSCCDRGCSSLSPCLVYWLQPTYFSSASPPLSPSPAEPAVSRFARSSRKKPARPAGTKGCPSVWRSGRRFTPGRCRWRTARCSHTMSVGDSFLSSPSSLLIQGRDIRISIPYPGATASNFSISSFVGGRAAVAPSASGAPNSKNICSKPAGATEISIFAG